MARIKKPDPAQELAQLEKIKKLVIIAMFSDDLLMDRFVLKGGNALDIVHKISTRASVDVDLSMNNDFTVEERASLDFRIERALRDTFLPERYRVFDVKIQNAPLELTDDLADFWGGYSVEFKLIESGGYDKFKNDLDALRRNALQLGQGKKFLIDISKHEYTDSKMSAKLDSHTIFVYTAEMMVCEKLRAICQQMTEYGAVVKRNRAGSSRARDFIDIHTLCMSIGKTAIINRDILAQVFSAKRVRLPLLRNTDMYREFHQVSFVAVKDSVKPGVVLREFDFYFDFVLRLINQLEPLGDE